MDRLQRNDDHTEQTPGVNVRWNAPPPKIRTVANIPSLRGPQRSPMVRSSQVTFLPPAGSRQGARTEERTGAHGSGSRAAPHPAASAVAASASASALAAFARFRGRAGRARCAASAAASGAAAAAGAVPRRGDEQFAVRVGKSGPPGVAPALLVAVRPAARRSTTSRRSASRRRRPPLPPQAGRSTPSRRAFAAAHLFGRRGDNAATTMRSAASSRASGSSGGTAARAPAHSAMHATTLLILERACVGPNVERFATCHRSTPATAGRMPRAKYRCTRRKALLYHTALRNTSARLQSMLANSPPAPPAPGRLCTCLLVSYRPLATRSLAGPRGRTRSDTQAPLTSCNYRQDGLGRLVVSCVERRWRDFVVRAPSRQRQ